jgi:hypothetical protein
MGRAETETRVVLRVSHDAEDGCPVEIGADRGLVLATWLAGGEVRVSDVGPALGPQERERGAFLRELERRIGSVAARIGAEPMYGPGINAPKRGTRERDVHYTRHGRLEGLCEAYELLTGKPRATAVHIGLEAWAARERFPWEKTEATAEGGAS